MISRNTLLLIVDAIIFGITWTLFTYYIRRNFNPGATGIGAKNFVTKQLSGNADLSIWWNDSMYGGIAMCLAFITRKYISDFIKLIL